MIGPYCSGTDFFVWRSLLEKTLFFRYSEAQYVRISY